MTELSVVVPVYGCAACVEALHARIRAALDPLQRDYEIVLVDDRSPDASWPALVALADTDPRVKAVRLSRNFGQQAAITAGLSRARGRWVAVLDCDLQDPPELIPELYRMATEGGYDLVLAKRSSRRRSPIRRALTSAYVCLRNAIAGSTLDTDYATLSILSRKVVDAFLAVRDQDRHYMLILDWLGFRRTAIEFAQQPRHAGKSAYTPAGLLRLAMAGFFFQTTNLLNLIVYAGFALAAAGAMLAGFFLYSYFTEHPLPGFTSVIVALLFVGGFLAIALGVTGLYVGKIFTQVKNRPLFVIDETRERSG
ncbi:MAG: glycosyltransferase [Thermoleophilia bacterium]|nr:glycosyltransferase [Thermoleophilia bacterium]